MREEGGRTGALDVDVGLVELLDELGEALEITVHCVQARMVSMRVEQGVEGEERWERRTDS